MSFNLAVFVCKRVKAPLNCLAAKSCPTLCHPMDCIACQALLSMGFPRQKYWSGLLFPFPGDLPNPGIEPGSPASQADSLPLSHRGSPMVNKKIVRSDYLSGSSPTWNWNLVPLTTFLPNIIALCFVFPISKQWPRRAERMVKARGTFKVDSTAI